MKSIQVKPEHYRKQVEKVNRIAEQEDRSVAYITAKAIDIAYPDEQPCQEKKE